MDESACLHLKGQSSLSTLPKVMLEKAVSLPYDPLLQEDFTMLIIWPAWKPDYRTIQFLG